MELPKAVGYGSDKAHWVDLGVAVNVAAWVQPPAGGEQFVESGVADELMGNAPRRSLNLRGHERPIDTLVLI
jgi:adenylate cyclase